MYITGTRTWESWLVKCTLLHWVHIGLSKSFVCFKMEVDKDRIFLYWPCSLIRVEKDCIEVIWLHLVYFLLSLYCGLILTKRFACNWGDNYFWSVHNFLLCVLFKVIHITGRLRIRMALTHSRSVPNQIMGMVVVAHALPPPTINEVRIDCQMFVTRVNMDLNIVYCENR